MWGTGHLRTWSCLSRQSHSDNGPIGQQSVTERTKSNVTWSPGPAPFEPGDPETLVKCTFCARVPILREET